jgi:CheY-like chemotaxis protein
MVLMMQRTRTRPIILLVEDYEDSRQMLTLLLQDMDYSVLPAANGKEALAEVATNDIDLVLTDFNLPDMTGPAVVRSVRRLRDGLGRHVPCIMLTAFDGDEHRALAAEAGCEVFLNKPPDFDLLKETIDRLLERKERDERSPQVNSLRGSRNVKVDPCPTSL